MNIKDYLNLAILIFFTLVILFIIATYYYPNPSLNAILAVLLGSSLTGTVTLGLELNRTKTEDRKLTFALNSEIGYNMQSLNDNLKVLQTENGDIDLDKKIKPSFPLTPIKTDMWDLISSHMDKSTLGDNYEAMIKIARKIDYMNEQLKTRQKYIESCLFVNNTPIDTQDLKLYNNNIMSNMKSAYGELAQLKCKFEGKGN